MILKALNRDYVSEKSERDNKPFSIFKKFLLGFAGWSFFGKFPPEGQLNHETYIFSKNPYIHTIHTCNAYNTYMQYIYNAYLH